MSCRYIQSTCATTGEGLYEGLDWLSNNIANKVLVSFQCAITKLHTCLNKILSFNQHSHDLWNKSDLFCCLALPRMSCTHVWHTDILILNECRPEWTILLFHGAHLHMARHGHFDPQTIIVSLESIVFLC